MLMERWHDGFNNARISYISKGYEECKESSVPVYRGQLLSAADITRYYFPDSFGGFTVLVVIKPTAVCCACVIIMFHRLCLVALASEVVACARPLGAIFCVYNPACGC